eukprot:jgi/Ulvmu1/1517/UM011_0247.1
MLATATKPPTTTLVAFPYRSTKVVHFIRHGNGFHNNLPDPALYKSYDYHDAHLTTLGWAQAHAVQQHFQSRSLQAQLIVSSPLTRTLETTAGAFGNHDVSVTSDTAAKDIVMCTIPDIEGKCTQHVGVGMPSVPVIAHELCRETLGVHPCDARRPISEIKQQFPGVDFSLIESNEDVLWKEGEREEANVMRERGVKFAEWLMQRPEKQIAVVSHSGFIHSFFQNFGQHYDHQVAQHMHRHYANCEVRSIILADPTGQHSQASLEHDHLHFAGGNEGIDPELSSMFTNYKSM